MKRLCAFIVFVFLAFESLAGEVIDSAESCWKLSVNTPVGLSTPCGGWYPLSCGVEADGDVPVCACWKSTGCVLSEGQGYTVVNQRIAFPLGTEAPPELFGNPPPPPSTPPDTGIMSLALGYGLTAAGIALGLVGAVAGAPVVAAGGGAVALFGAVMAATGGSSSPASVQAAVPASAPVQVTFQPASQPVPAPGGGTPAAVATTPDGKFTPSGGASGTWAQNGASGTWNYTPPGATAPTASISPDGSQVTQTIPNASGSSTSGAAPGNSSLVITRLPDGSVSVTQATNVMVTDTNGNPTTVPTAVTQSFTNTGQPVGGSQTYVSETATNGSPTGGGTNITVQTGGTNTGGTGTGGTGTGGTGTGSGNTTGAGDCGGVQCATEGTQLANKGLLGGIKDALTKTEEVGDPTAKTGKQIQDAGGLKTGFDGLGKWRLPAHTSVCPRFEFDWSVGGSSQTISETAHCDLFKQNEEVLSVVFTAIWTMAALGTVLRA